MIIRKEFIGKKAEVVDAKNKSNIGIKGKIKNETKNTIRINDKTLLKKNITIKIDNVLINCEKMAKRPEERIKIRRK